MGDFPVQVLPGQKVVVETMEGLVSSVHAPEGIAVVVVDHDALADPDLVSDEDVRELMTQTPELPWGQDGYTYRKVMRDKPIMDSVETEITPGPRGRRSELAERQLEL
jgi:hypothetical protein